MWQVIQGWFNRYFSDPEAVVLFFLLSLGILLLWTLGSALAPVIASIIIAYLLDWIVMHLVEYKIPRTLAVVIVFLLFIGVVLIAGLGLLPLLWQQSVAFMRELPTMLNKGQTVLLELPREFPEIFSVSQTQHWLVEFKTDLAGVGQYILSRSLASIPSVIGFMVYIILVPLLVYFFLMDKKTIVTWFSGLMPQRSELNKQVWHEVDMQIGNYVRGKVFEVGIVAVVTYILFIFFHLEYAILLAALVGLSVIVPYVGAIAVTVPVLLVALLQWGWGTQFIYLAVSYAVLMVIDGNVLVPILFSETVNLHPVAIIIAVLVFGAIWGFWGIFFAIPLATLVRALFNAWPRVG